MTTKDCICWYIPEYRGGGYSEVIVEYEPMCPVHSGHLYDPTLDMWVLRPPKSQSNAKEKQMTTSNVIDDVTAERARQIAKGYTANHDDEHGAIDLITWAHSYVLRAVAQGNRSDVVKAAALLVAAAESIDRLGSFGGTAVKRGK